MVVVGGISYTGFVNTNDGFESYREMARDTNLMGLLEADMLLVRMNVKDYLISSSEKDIEQYKDYLKKMFGLLETAKKEVHKKEYIEKILFVEKEINAYQEGFQKVVGLQKERIQLVENVLDVKGPEMEKSLSAIMESADKDKDLEGAFHAGLALRSLLLGRLYVNKFLDSNDPKEAERVSREFTKLEHELELLDKQLENQTRRALLKKVQDGDNEYHVAFDKTAKAIFERNGIISGTLDKIGPEIAEAVASVKLDLKKDQDELGPRLVASNERTELLILVIGISALVLGITLSFFITRSITRPLNRVIDGLTEGAEQVASAAGEVSSASQSLAEGSSEQAASIEETSSSLEEMSSMTKQNADNSQQANNLMSEAKQVVANANESMSQLTTSMGEISKASEETSKIVKTIDEIAFQTNLLALNAAVEAARAGEAGAGFAVVADEVRNLAMRAADAAKNTANLIEGTVKRVNDGSEIVTRTNEAFKQVAGSSAKAADLVAEISAASNEQAQGIGQINTAVTELNKVTQQNAANAEESAAASEELSAQAETMQGMVAELVAMAGGSAKAQKADSRGGHHSQKSTKQNKASSSAINKLKFKAGGVKKSKAPVAEAVIPLDDKELSDF
jgi:methyl-accepting chemotaxis protein